MNDESAREYSYQEFSDFVRQFNQEAMLSAVARRAVSLPFRIDDDTKAYVATPPWALAAVAKASICNGNPYRRRLPSDGDLVVACQMHDNLAADELGRGELNSVFAILTRIAYEQFPYQESPFEELARPLAFFDGYSGRKDLEVVSKQSLEELVGAPTPTAVGIVMMLAASAETNVGFFEPAWLNQKNFAELLAVLPREEILAVVDSVFASSTETFRQEDADAAAKVPLRYLDRYSFNPLTARPLVRLPDGRLIAPVPQLIPRRLSPLELYYLGIRRWGSAFARDMGELLEDYVGRQLRTLPNVGVHSEIVYTERKNQMKSIDWFLVFDDLVVLVEAKATRVPLGARAANESAQEAYSATLGSAFKQLDRTLGKLRSGATEFSHIPTDRPVIGIVATLDPWYIANSFGRGFLPTPGLPTVVASVRDIEHLVGLGQRRSVSEVLLEITRAGDERQTWELGVALNHFHTPADRNPILEQAWSQLPFGANAPGS